MSASKKSSPAHREAAIVVEGLRLEAGTAVLLEEAAFRLEEGELCLLVGASGSGKSLTLRLLAGILEPTREVHWSGRVRVLGQDPATCRRTGIQGAGMLFQDFALFDDLNANDNVLFGLDHGSGQKKDRQQQAASLLEEFGLKGALMPAQMSGGMRQRLALARALAYQPRLLLYDEPTSGLDPAMSEQVARRIQAVHKKHSMTSLVVTHDLSSLRQIATRIIFLDPLQRTFVDLSQEAVDQALQHLRDHHPEERLAAPSRPRWQRWPQRFLDRTGAFVQRSLETLLSLWPRFPRPRWGWRFFYHALCLTSLGSALPFLGLAGLIVGFITTFFLFSLLPLRGFTEPVLIEEFLGSLGFGLYRVVIPLITCLLFASRSGAAMAAELGNRRLTHQVEALQMHGVAPRRYLLTPLALASLVGIPLLFLVAWLVARLTTVGVFLATHPGQGAFAFSQHFKSLLGQGGLWPPGTGFVLSKLLLSALGTAGIAYHLALAPKDSGAAVARGVTNTIIKATIFVLLVHLVFAFFEF